MVRGFQIHHFFGSPFVEKTRQAAGYSSGPLVEAGCSDATVGYLKAGSAGRAGNSGSVRVSAGCSAVWLALTDSAPEEASAVDIAGLGLRLASVRAERGLTKADLVEATGLSSSAILGTSVAQKPSRYRRTHRQSTQSVPGWFGYGIGPMVLPPRRRTRSAPAAASLVSVSASDSVHPLPVASDLAISTTGKTSALFLDGA